MGINEILLAILGIVATIGGLSVFYNMPNDFLKEFEKSCRAEIKKRDKEFEEREKMNKELKKWLFGGK